MQQKNPGSIRFSFKEEAHKLRSLSSKKRWEYIWEYYKRPLFLFLCTVGLIWMVGSFAVNAFLGTFFPKEPLSMAVAVAGFQNCNQWLDECMEAIAYDSQTESLQLLTSTPYRNDQQDFVISSTLWFTAGQPDIFVCDYETLTYLMETDMLAAFPDVWPEELLSLARRNGWTEDTPYWLDISSTVFCQQHGLTAEPVYLCMNTSGLGFQRALDIVAYILFQPSP